MQPRLSENHSPLFRPTLHWCLALVLLSPACSAERSELSVYAGHLEIQRELLESRGPHSLQGSWQFRPEGDFLIDSRPEEYIHVPGTWDASHFADAGDSVHRRGTYKLQIEQDEPGLLAMRFTEIMTESCVYLDGTLIHCQGSLEEPAIANTTPFTVILDAGRQSVLEIQVSNMHHRRGGIFGAVYLGTPQQIRNLDRQRMSRYLLVGGGLLLTTLYFGILALFERSSGTSLTLALFCMVVFLRVLTSGEKPVVAFFPDIPYEFYLRVQYITFFLSVATVLHHVRALFPMDTSARATILAYALAGTFCLFALFAPTTLLTHTLDYYVFIFFGVSLYTLYCVVMANVRKRIGSLLILIGMSALLLAATVDFLRVYEVVRIPYLIGDAILILILCQAVATSLQNRNVHLQMGQLQSERDMAETAARNNREFLSRMSHELRTPLHSIIHIGHLLREERDVERISDYIQTLQSASEHLLTLVNDVLDFNRLAQGKLRYQENSFSLRLLMNRVVLIHKERAAARGLSLNLHLSDELPDRFLGDSHRIAQVMHNLIGNAMKFTEKGSIDVSVRNLSLQDEPSVEFSVSDTGTGMSENQIPHIFESYFQGEFHADRKHEGTGLGLAISRELVRLMGGELQVQSELGRGSRFWFALPLVADQVPHRILEMNEISEALSLANPDSGEGQKRDFRRELVFVVDDNPDNCKLTGRFLERWNLTHRQAGSGRECLSLLQEEYPHLILLDLHMPELDGFATLAAIRDAGYTGPVIAATADVSNETRIRIDAAGFDGFIGKPFSPATLFQALSGYLQHSPGSN